MIRKGPIGLLSSLSMLLQAGKTAFSGDVLMSNSQVEATGATYTFDLSFNEQVQEDGKIVVRFPTDFEAQFAVTGVNAVSGFSKTGSLSFDYVSSVRLLTIESGFPTEAIFTEIVFEVEGVTNPSYASQTGAFKIDSYNPQGSTFVFVESSDATIVATPTAGALSAETMTLQDPTVGAYSTLTVGMSTVHAIPQDGKIEIEFPKWNYFADSQSQMDSFVSTSTSPGQVLCNAVSNIPMVTGTDLGCILTHGTSIDTLQINFDGYLSGDVPEATALSLTIDGVRAPPTTSAVTGFSFRTTSLSGGVIDQTDAATTITLKANAIAQSQSSNTEVSADDPSINEESNLTLRIQTVNPLDIDSNIQVTIPTDFNTESLSEVTMRGSALNPTVTWTYDEATRVLSIQKFNLKYIGSRGFIYMTLGPVTNPGETNPTSSFTYQIQDPSSNAIEECTDGIYFTASAGGFSQLSISTNKSLINERLVEYTFTMKPQDVFTADAILKITLPTQISVSNDCFVTGGTSGVVQVGVDNAQVEVLFDRIIYIRNAFPNGLTVVEPFFITLTDFTNPPTTQETDSFEFKIFYVENVSEVSIYQGTQKTFTATPSDAISLDVPVPEPSSYETGVSVTLSFTATMELEASIEKQSFVRLAIPAKSAGYEGYTITDYDRTAATCTQVSGFSDELTCDFEEFQKGSQYFYLNVRGGFDSKTFESRTTRSFSFTIGEINNPNTTEMPIGFGIGVYDKYGGKMYEAPDKTFALGMRASDFAFAHVTHSIDDENSQANSASGVSYVVTATFSVDTQVSAYIIVEWPDEVSYDSDGASICSGQSSPLPLNIQGCFVEPENKRINIPLSRDTTNSTPHKTGTTVKIKFGPFTNPLSLKETSSFSIKTVVSLSQKNIVYNEVTSGVTITNQVPGQIQITDKQFNPELKEPTMLKLAITTVGKIPTSASMTLILPPVVQVDKNSVVMLINDKETNPTVNDLTKSLSLSKMPSSSDSYTIELLAGVENPETGPYSFDYFQIEFKDSSGYTIDKITIDEPLVTVECTSNCETCKDSLSTCTSCSYNAVQDVNYFLSGNECMTDCGYGFFNNQAGFVCSPCEEGCLDCTTAANKCISCDKDYPKPYADIQAETCVEQCPTRTYLNTAQTVCEPCVSPCYSCESLDVCLSCDRNNPANPAVFFLETENQCLKDCPTTSVATPSKLCDACTAPCETCESLPGNCRSCVEGYFFFKEAECVTECPFLYTEDSELRRCAYFGELSIPVPFSIIAFVMTVGVGISAFVKGADREGREQEGTAFFLTMLALVDMLLRVTWAVLAYSVYQKEYYVTFGWLCGILGISCFLNIFVWRRYFYVKYRYEDEDPLFSAYMMKYSYSGNVIIFLSYLLSFQAIRLTYSRILGKKKFMARFTRRRRYFRLIGRLTVFETIFIYLPAVALNIYSLTSAITNSKEQQYWLNIDSLILVSYAIVLIIVVLTQREKLMNYQSYFKFGELFQFGDDADEEETIMEESPMKGVGKMSQQREIGMVHQPDDPVEVHSAFDHEEMLKMKMYQFDQRYTTQERAQKSHKRNPSHLTERGRVVSVTDYNEYRKLEDKRDRIMLKKTLYEKKKVSDEAQVVILNEELNQYQHTKKDLSDQLSALRNKLKDLQKDIVSVDKNRKKELHKVEQEKRRDIIRRAGREVPYQSHSGATASVRTKSQLAKANANINSQTSKSPRDVPAGSKRRRQQRGGQRHQQSKSPRQSFHKVNTQNDVSGAATVQDDQHNDSSLIMGQSPNIFQANMSMEEPITVSDNATQNAIDLQFALEQETEQASNLKAPAMNGPSEPAETELASRYPALQNNNRGGQMETEKMAGGPSLDRARSPNETTEEAVSYPHFRNENMIQETEIASDIGAQRPVQTLRSDQVDSRVDNALMEGQQSQNGDDNLESFGAYKNENELDGKKKDDDNDSVW